MFRLLHLSQGSNIGKGKTCLLVGGGHSVNHFDWDRLPHDVYVISSNDHKTLIADMVVYMDKDMNAYYEQYSGELYDDTLLVGYKHKGIANVCDRCDYYYTHDDMVFGDTGFHMLQFADTIFNFSKIYLIGYDYSTIGNSYHWHEQFSDKKKMRNFIKHSESVLPKYKEYKWTSKIYNLSEKSRLDVFEKVPTII